MTYYTTVIFSKFEKIIHEKYPDIGYFLFVVSLVETLSTYLTRHPNNFIIPKLALIYYRKQGSVERFSSSIKEASRIGAEMIRRRREKIKTLRDQINSFINSDPELKEALYEFHNDIYSEYSEHFDELRCLRSLENRNDMEQDMVGLILFSRKRKTAAGRRLDEWVSKVEEEVFSNLELDILLLENRVYPISRSISKKNDQEIVDIANSFIDNPTCLEVYKLYGSSTLLKAAFSKDLSGISDNQNIFGVADDNISEAFDFPMDNVSFQGRNAITY